MRCEDVRDRIVEQTLEGGLAPAAALAEHLHGCPDCLDFYSRLDEVDLALHALPLESLPAWQARRIAARVTAAGTRQDTFLHWTLWVPAASLLIGLFWAYVTLVWPSGPDLIRSFDPTVIRWLAQFEQWVAMQQSTLNVVAISVGAGLFVTVLATVLGLYVGRDRMTARHGH
jgi:predicted anti-sigma-YlaC factor YlaD